MKLFYGISSLRDRGHKFQALVSELIHKGQKEIH